MKTESLENNGMAATNAILSMSQWAYMEVGDEKAVQFVAMATPQDWKANADAFAEITRSENSKNYATVDVICEMAHENEVDAVWPGWGHASEKPLLSETCKKLGIKFIGPTAPVMRVLGDKIAANILAESANAPSIPWSGSYGGKMTARCSPTRATRA
jgi:acetyl-CoA carboxylase / biotin carboxylase 1